MKYWSNFKRRVTTSTRASFTKSLLNMFILHLQDKIKVSKIEKNPLILPDTPQPGQFYFFENFNSHFKITKLHFTTRIVVICQHRTEHSLMNTIFLNSGYEKLFWFPQNQHKKGRAQNGQVFSLSKEVWLMKSQTPKILNLSFHR